MKDEELFYRPPTVSMIDITYMNSDRVVLYEAPEVLKREPPNEMALSWTIGCIIYELVTLEAAFCDRENPGNMVALITDIIQGKRPPMIGQTQYSDTLLRTIDQCLELQPSKRPHLEGLIIMATLKQAE